MTPLSTPLRETNGSLPVQNSAAEPVLRLRGMGDAMLPARAVHAEAAQGGPKRILVLGATSGIAEACCRLWAERGDSLYLVARNQERLQTMAADLRTRGAAAVETAVVDLDDTARHPALLAHAINALGGLDVAFVAAGVLGVQAQAERGFEEAHRILQTNLLAVASLLTWLGNYCAQRHGGTLAVLSSVAGDRGRKSNYVYGASKAGLTAFVDGLRNRIDREGVRVMTVKPGPVHTAMTEGFPDKSGFADVGGVAATLVRAIDRGQDVVYVPGVWRWKMAAVRAIPERWFKKLNL